MIAIAAIVAYWDLVPQDWSRFVVAFLYAWAALLLLRPHRIPLPSLPEFAELPTRTLDMAKRTKIRCTFQSPESVDEDAANYLLEYSGVDAAGKPIPVTTCGPFPLGKDSDPILFDPGDQITLHTRIIDFDGLTGEAGPALSFTTANTAPRAPAKPVAMAAQSETLVED